MNNKNTHTKDKKISAEIENTSNLLKYLKERIKLRTKAVRSIDNYDNKVWIGDIPESKYCEIEPWIKNLSANSVIEWFNKHPPLSGFGKLVLGEALMSKGDLANGKNLI